MEKFRENFTILAGGWVQECLSILAEWISYHCIFPGGRLVLLRVGSWAHKGGDLWIPAIAELGRD